MITYGFIKRLNEDETMSIVNKIIAGTFGIMFGILMDFFVLLTLPFLALTIFMAYMYEKIIGEE